MDRGVAVLLTAVTGGLVALQAPINSLLGHRIGTWPAVVVSFAIGTIALVGIAMLSGGLGSVVEIRTVPWYYLLGGLLGAAYVTSILVTVRTLGELGTAEDYGALTVAVVQNEAVRLRDVERALGSTVRRLEALLRAPR